MSNRMLKVFVSASADLEPEREVVAEALAKFPVPLPWEIRRTAHAGEQTPHSLESIRDSDFCVVLLGQDVTAPIGAELETAIEAGIPLFALVKTVARTPAGRFFRYNSVRDWEEFSSANQLRRLVTTHSARILMAAPILYGLDADEIVALNEYLEDREKAESDSGPGVAGGKETAGAQEGAIIVSPKER